MQLNKRYLCPCSLKHDLKFSSHSYYYEDSEHIYVHGITDLYWFFRLKKENIQVGNAEGGCYVLYRLTNQSFFINDFTVDESLNIIEKYKNLRSFI